MLTNLIPMPDVLLADVAGETPGLTYDERRLPGERGAVVRVWRGRRRGAALGFAVIYRAEAGEAGRWRVDLSGGAMAQARHYSGAVDLDGAIRDVRVLLALPWG